jgi:hypothetical protein
MKKIVIIISFLLGLIVLFGCDNGIEKGSDSTDLVTLDIVKVTLKSNGGHPGFESAYDFSKEKSKKIYFSDSFPDYKGYDMVYYIGGFSGKMKDEFGNVMKINLQIDMGEKSFDEVECPDEIPGYDYSKPMKEGHIYCIKTQEGDNVKLNVLSMSEEKSSNPDVPNYLVTFEWKYET